MTEEQLTELIKDYVQDAGSLRALAKQWKVSPQYLCDLVHGRRRAGDKVLGALGLKRETCITTLYRAQK
jgi:hypothetical protein